MVPATTIPIAATYCHPRSANETIPKTAAAKPAVATVCPSFQSVRPESSLPSMLIVPLPGGKPEDQWRFSHVWNESGISNKAQTTQPASSPFLARLPNSAANDLDRL